MTPPTPRKKTALELAEERRLAAMTPDERERLEAARKKLRERAERRLRQPTAHRNETGQEPARVKLDNLARAERERLAAMEPAEHQALERARRKMRRFPVMSPRPEVDPEQVARDAEDLL